MALPPILDAYARAIAPTAPPALPQGGRKGKRPPAPVHGTPLAPPDTRYALLPLSWAPAGFHRQAPQLTFPGGSVASPLRVEAASGAPQSYGQGVDWIRTPVPDVPAAWIVAVPPRTQGKRKAERQGRRKFHAHRAPQGTGSSSAPLKQLSVGATSAEGVLLPPAGAHKGPPTPAQGSGWVHPLNPSGWVYDHHGVRSDVYAVRNRRYPTAPATALAKPYEQALKLVSQAQKTLDKLDAQLGGRTPSSSSSPDESAVSGSGPVRRTRRQGQAGRSQSQSQSQSRSTSAARSASPSVPLEGEPERRAASASGLRLEVHAAGSDTASAGEDEPEAEAQRTPRRKAALMAGTRTKTQFQEEKEALKDRSPLRRAASGNGTPAAASASPTPSPRPAAAAAASGGGHPLRTASGAQDEPA